MPRHLIFIELIQSSDYGVEVTEKTQSLLYNFSLGGLKVKTKLAVIILIFWHNSCGKKKYGLKNYFLPS